MHENFVPHRDVINAGYLERLLRLAEGNPLAIKILLQDLGGRRMSPWAYFELISTGNYIRVDNKLFEPPCGDGAQVINLWGLFVGHQALLGIF
jgi:hypothetical protein